jgi:hypothetical protein
VWAVGWALLNETQAFYRFDGSKWQKMTAPPHTVRDIWATGTNELWAADEDHYVSHWDGASWHHTDVGQDIQGIYGFGNSDIWVAGATVLHFNGNIWQDKGGGGPSIWGPTSGDMWTGDGAHLVAGKWQPTPSEGTGFKKVIGATASDVFLLGDGADPVSYHLKNGNSSIAASGSARSDVWSASASDYWLVGERVMPGLETILHGDPETSMVEPTAVGPSMPPDPEAPYRVASTTVQQKVGASWMDLKTFAKAFPLGKYMAWSDKTLWVCSANELYQYTAGSWSTLGDAPACASSWLQVDGEGRLWLAQYDPSLEVYVYDGAWTHLSSDGIDVKALAFQDFCVRGHDAWLSAQLTAYRFNGSGWDRYSLGVDPEVAAGTISIASDGRVYTGTAASPQLVLTP